MEAHHITPTHASQKAKGKMSDAEWKKKKERDAKGHGIYHGDHPRNLAATTGPKTPKGRKGIPHRAKGYHGAEGEERKSKSSGPVVGTSRDIIAARNRKASQERKRKELGRQNEETTMRDNNLYGNAYAGSRLGFKIDSGEHRKAQRAKKIRDRTKTGDEGSEIAKKKAKGPKLYGEGKKWDSYKKAVSIVLRKKKEQKKHEYPAGASGGDAGRRAKERLDQREREKYVSPFKPVDHE